MATKYKTRAFVFKKNDRNESDRLFSVFTDEFGRLDIFAKAIRKTTSKLRSGIDVFFLSEVEFIQGKNKKTLTDALAIKKFANINGDLKKINIVYRVAEVLDYFIKGQERDFETFNLLDDFLNRLDCNTIEAKNCQLAYQYFFWNFISLQGYKSEVNNCASCQEKLDPFHIYFSGKDGGVVCNKCFALGNGAQRINSDVVKVIRIILKKDWATLMKLKIEESSQNLLSLVSEKAMLAFCPS